MVTALCRDRGPCDCRRQLRFRSTGAQRCFVFTYFLTLCVDVFKKGGLTQLLDSTLARLFKQKLVVTFFLCCDSGAQHLNTRCLSGNSYVLLAFWSSNSLVCVFFFGFRFVPACMLGKLEQVIKAATVPFGIDAWDCRHPGCVHILRK